MKKAQIVIDLTKLDKTKIVEKEFTTKDGVVVKQKLYKLDAIPLKQVKFIKEGDTWILNKVAFLSEPQTKEEREKNGQSKIIGDVLEFAEKATQPSGEPYPYDDNGAMSQGEEDIPF